MNQSNNYLNLPFSLLYSKMAKVLDCGFKVREFELRSHYYVHFRTNIFEKGMNPFTPRYG